MNRFTALLFASALLASCGDNSSQNANGASKIETYRASVAIPSGTVETPELQECLRGYATGEQFSYGNTPESRWNWDVKPCLKYGPAPK